MCVLPLSAARLPKTPPSHLSTVALEVTLRNYNTWKFAQYTPKVLRFEPILDFAQWQLCDIEWVTPSRACIARKGVWPHDLESLGVARDLGPPKPFLEVAAKRGFWGLGIPMLTKLAKVEYNLQLVGNDAEKKFCLIKAVLGCSDKVAASCLEHRVSLVTDEEQVHVFPPKCI